MSLLGWPLIIVVLGISLICTFASRFVQFRYFIQGFKELFFPPKQDTAGDMTSLQAFINTLSTNLGNGSIAGMATAIFSGGPGAAFWALLFGIILMAVRYAEVYLSVYFAQTVSKDMTLGGPMIYLRYVVGGRSLAYVYALSCFFFGLTGANALQTNSISLSLQATCGLSTWLTAFIMLLFTFYILLGGAPRILAFSERIVYVKVIVFLTATLLILLFNWSAIGSALYLIIRSAFSSHAFNGGVIGFSVQQAIRFGMNRSIFATESGLGTAAILFGFTGKTNPVESGVLAMMSTFISTLICFIIALCIVVSGVWNSGLTSTPLVIASFSTVFGSFGGPIVTFLAISFGIGVLVSYIYITRAAWLFLTGGSYVSVFIFCYAAAAFAGAIASVESVWLLIEIVNGVMLVVNLFGILYLMPVIARGLYNYEQLHS